MKDEIVLLSVYIDTDDDSNVYCSVKHKRFEDIEKCRAYLRNMIWEFGINIEVKRSARGDEDRKLVNFYRGSSMRRIEDILEKMWKATFRKLVFEKPMGNWDFKYEIVRIKK